MLQLVVQISRKQSRIEDCKNGIKQEMMRFFCLRIKKEIYKEREVEPNLKPFHHLHDNFNVELYM